MSGLEQEGDGPPDEVEFGEVVEAEVKRLVRHPREETARLKQVAADGEHGSAPYIEIALVARFPLIARYALIEHRTRRGIVRARALIDRYGGRAVFFGRFVSVLRETIAWVAGRAGMPWPNFLLWNAPGGIAWATAIGLLAVYGGKALADAVSRYGLYAGAAAVAAAVLIFAGRRLIRRMTS